MLNSKQVQELFEKEAILINDRDVIPQYAVEKLFGKAAMEFAKSIQDYKNLGYWSEYYIDGGSYKLAFLTYKGFRIAATYSNIDETRNKTSQEVIA